MRLTIDELAHRSGTAASTIRLYQTKGLLPPPDRQGRVGYYDHRHLARLKLIAQLQEQGFSLASIGRLVDAWQQGQGLEAVLGLETEIAQTWADEEPVSLRPDELVARFAGAELTPELIQRTLDLELIAVEGDRIVVSSPRFLEIGTELATLGIPVEEIIDEYEALQRATGEIAERFARLFERHLWGPFVASGLPADDVRHLTEVLQRLSALAEAVLALTVRRSLKRAATGFLAARVEELDQAGVLDTFLPLVEAAGLDLDA